MLRQIRVTNFKGIGKAEIDTGLATILIGPNGVGKSSIAQALILLRQSVDTEGLVTDGELITLGGFKDILRKGQSDKTLSIGITGVLVSPADLAQLLPQFLDECIALGETARRLREALTNSLGGIRIHSQEKLQAMPEMKPRTKAPKGEQLDDSLQGELAIYEKVGLFQRSVTERTAYRYRGALLRYQKALGGARPTMEASKIFLAHLRQQGYSASTLRIYRAALQGFHAWRGENLVFPIRMSRHLPPYIEAPVVASILRLARENPKDYLILRLMSDAGLRRREVVDLKVKNISQKALRFRGKGGKDRMVPLTEELAAALSPFCLDKGPDERVVGVGEGVIYRVVKKYGRLAGRPEMKPHDLRHAFATRLLERGVNIRIVQELMGHTNVSTTQDYTAVVGSHLEEAIRVLNQPRQRAVPDEQIEKLMELVAKIAGTKGEPPSGPVNGISPVVYG